MIHIPKLDIKFKKKLVLSSDEEIEIPKGITYLIGLNGSGKTVLFKTFLGILPNDSEVLYDNNKIENSLSQIGMAYDRSYFLENLTGLDNLYYLNSISDVKANNSLIFSFYNEWKIGDEITKVKQYSLGMNKKLSIVFALIGDKEFYFFDEPYNGLDVESIQKLNKTILDLKNNGKTIIITCHEINVVKDYVDHIMIINDRKLSFFDNSKNILNDFIDTTEEFNIDTFYNKLMEVEV